MKFITICVVCVVLMAGVVLGNYGYDFGYNMPAYPVIVGGHGGSGGSDFFTLICFLLIFSLIFGSGNLGQNSNSGATVVQV